LGTCVHKPPPKELIAQLPFGGLTDYCRISGGLISEIQLGIRLQSVITHCSAPAKQFIKPFISSSEKKENGLLIFCCHKKEYQ
jgi:hypothetical protein